MPARKLGNTNEDDEGAVVFTQGGTDQTFVIDQLHLSLGDKEKSKKRKRKKVS